VAAAPAPSSAKSPWLRLDSLKARFALLLTLALLPPLIYSVYQAVDAFLTKEQSQAATVARVLNVISSYETDFFIATRKMLTSLAAAPAVIGGDVAACDKLLAQQIAQGGDFGSMAVTDAKGEVSCSSPTALLGINVASRGWFEELRSGRSFVVSSVVTLRDKSGQAIVAAVARHDGATGEFAGAVLVTIRVTAFATAVRNLALGPNSVAYVMDSDGILVVDQAGDKRPYYLGAPMVGYASMLVVGGDRELRAPGRDGIDRTYVAKEIADGALFVVVGLPFSSPWSSLDVGLIVGIFAPTVMLALAVLLIWLASDYLVIRHVRALSSAARAYSRGNLQARPVVAGASAELRELADVFGRMARRIESRERELKGTIEQKELLLREIHHRVKNNLQIVTSLLNLRAQSIQSRAARQAMLEAQTRIKALALVHRNLYEQDDVRSVELHAFLGELAELLAGIADPQVAGRVDVRTRIDATRVSTDQAIPIALLITEALSNAFKHAFPDGLSGSIEISLTNDGDHARLTISDDGIGFGDTPKDGAPADDEAEERDETENARGGGIGLVLIDLLAKQTGGTLEVDGRRGVRITLDFPLERAN
jgi:two-component sensor histidine kinase